MFFVKKWKTKVRLGFARDATDRTTFFPANDGWESLSSAHRDIPLSRVEINYAGRKWVRNAYQDGICRQQVMYADSLRTAKELGVHTLGHLASLLLQDKPRGFRLLSGDCGKAQTITDAFLKAVNGMKEFALPVSLPGEVRINLVHLVPDAHDVVQRLTTHDLQEFVKLHLTRDKLAVYADTADARKKVIQQEKVRKQVESAKKAVEKARRKLADMEAKAKALGA